PDYRRRMSDLQAISQRWLNLRRRNSRELQFLARPLDCCHDPLTRCFVAQRNGKALAFVLFDPLYEAGKLSGYAASLLRSAELGSDGWQDYIVLSAMVKFRHEKLQWRSLGLSPFAQADSPARLDSSPATRAIFSFWREHGNWLYNFRGVSFHKRFYPS